MPFKSSLLVIAIFFVSCRANVSTQGPIGVGANASSGGSVGSGGSAASGGSATSGGGGTPTGGTIALGGSTMAQGGATNDPILVGAGDIALCGEAGAEQTAKVLDGVFANGANSNGVVFTAGDNAYDDGLLSEYQNCYDPSWGRHKSRTRPVAGNHERDVSGKGGYFMYFGSAAGDPAQGAYYSYELGAWHVVVLDSFGTSVSAGSTQEKWLRADLAAHKNKCTVAIMHAPRFNSGSQHGNSISMQPLWQALYEADADVVIAGHEHIYERFAPQTPSGVADAQKGLREFLIGTGGATLYKIGTPQPNSEVRYNSSYGVLKLTLHANSYDWDFLPVEGASFSDTGTGQCH